MLWGSAAGGDGGDRASEHHPGPQQAGASHGEEQQLSAARGRGGERALPAPTGRGEPAGARAGVGERQAGTPAQPPPQTGALPLLERDEKTAQRWFSLPRLLP